MNKITHAELAEHVILARHLQLGLEADVCRTFGHLFEGRMYRPGPCVRTVHGRCERCLTPYERLTIDRRRQR